MARLAANLRACDQADQGGEVEVSYSPRRSTSPRAPMSHHTETMSHHMDSMSHHTDESSASTPGTKRSKWAQMAAERQMWDRQFEPTHENSENSELTKVTSEIITAEPSSVEFYTETISAEGNHHL